MKTNKISHSILVIVILSLALGLTPSCKESNDEPSERTDSVRINISDIQKQLGIEPAGSSAMRRDDSVSSLPIDTESTTAVRGLVIGTILVTSRETPYDSDVEMTDAVVDNLEDELINSNQFIVILTLPTTEEYVEIRSPMKDPDSGGLQIVAAAVDFPIEELGEVGENKHDDSMLYIGFIERFYSVKNIGKTVLPDTLVMKRACLNNSAIKGCATFQLDIDDNPVVTSAVEILGIRYNDDRGEHTSGGDLITGNFYSRSSSGDFPIRVWSSAAADQAVTKLTSARSDIGSRVGGTGNIENLTVLTTHSKNTWESDECRSFWADSAKYNNTTELNAMIQASDGNDKICDVQTYKVTISGN